MTLLLFCLDIHLFVLTILYIDIFYVYSNYIVGFKYIKSYIKIEGALEVDHTRKLGNSFQKIFSNPFYLEILSEANFTLFFKGDK